MARYLVIEFKDNAQAEKLLEQVLEASRKGALYRVVGLFVKPGRYCECGDWGRINYGDKNQREGISRGEKFGWWVCTRCGKPRRAGHQLVNQLKPGETFAEHWNDAEYEFVVDGLSVGGNLRSKIERPKKFRKVKK